MAIFLDSFDLGKLADEAVDDDELWSAAIRSRVSKKDGSRSLPAGAHLVAVSTTRHLIIGRAPRGWTGAGRWRIASSKDAPWMSVKSITRQRSRKKQILHVQLADDSIYELPVLEQVGGDLADVAHEMMRQGNGGRIAMADELAKLKAMVDEGALTKEEWKRAKEQFVGRGEDQQQAAIQQLRRLLSLKRDGVLSESEFNSKKWDVLSRS